VHTILTQFLCIHVGNGAHRPNKAIHIPRLNKKAIIAVSEEFDTTSTFVCADNGQAGRSTFMQNHRPFVIPTRKDKTTRRRKNASKLSGLYKSQIEEATFC